MSLRSQKSDVKVIHSSLSHVLRLGLDSDFPGYPASIGLLLERSHSSPGIHLLSCAPKLSSLETGELLDTTDLEDIDTRLRQELLSQAKMCEQLSTDLLSHAKRLRTLSREETLIYDTDDGISPPPEFSTVPKACNVSTSASLNPPGKNHANLEDSDTSDIDLGAFDD